jgi:hypothetical protein
MCAGGVALDIAVFSAASALGLQDLSRAPELAIAIIAVDATVAMAAYMRLRGHSTQHNIEMSGSTLVGGAVLIGFFWLGWIPDDSFTSWIRLMAFMCGPLCALMLLVMVARFDHYGGRVGMPIAEASASDAYTCPMHPEVRRSEPGACPVCGMTLVRRV